MQLYFLGKFWTKWLPLAILDDRNSLWITFLAILDQIQIFYFFYKMAAGGHFGCPKFTFDRLSGHFRSISNFNFFLNFDKMADVGHFRCPKLTFDRISGHFRSLRNLNFFEFFDKMATVSHFGCPKFTLDRISDHFRSIVHFGFSKNSLWIAILAISDQYRIFFFGGHFGCLYIYIY